MFDPEKVERYAMQHQSGPAYERMTWDENYVRASDYDQLLVLYRELEAIADNRFNLIQQLASDMAEQTATLESMKGNK